MEPSQERGTRGTAASGVIEVREPETADGQRIKIRRGNLAAEAADIGIAHIVGEDDDDVGPLGSVANDA